jgi:CheY-like chemotaxis protein
MSSSAAALSCSQRTILVIEDYSDTRDLISAMLRRKGYKVIEAEDGLEGLLKASASYPDLIIMDLALPEMDGVEAARRIHEMPKLSHTPILVISAFLTSEVREDVAAAGCVASVSKPFDADEFMRKVSELLTDREDPKRGETQFRHVSVDVE